MVMLTLQDTEEKKVSLTVRIIFRNPGLEFILVEGLTECVKDVHELTTLHEASLALVKHLKHLFHGCRPEEGRGEALEKAKEGGEKSQDAG